MKREPITRRTMLKSATAVLALPTLEIMASAADNAPAAPPPRFAFFYVPHGVNTKTWFPVKTGAAHDFSPALEPLRPFKSDLTILGGLHHHRAAASNHDVMDSHLTGTNHRHTGRNSQSFDQLLAERIGSQSYLKSLVLSTAGGIGSPGLATTLSFNRSGAGVGADKNPRAVFNKLFPSSEQAGRDALRDRLLQRTSILDALREETQSFMRPLGHNDRDKMNEYLTSVREVERAIQIREQQLRQGSSAASAAKLALHANPSNNMEERQTYIRCMFDLIYLGFVADTTRVATYAISDESNNTFENWSELCGSSSWHGTAHHRGDPEQDAAKQTKIDRWLVEQFAYLVGRLKSTREGEKTLLDRCMLLYGSGNSRTHLHRNLPLVFAGGNAYNFRHGQYLTYVVRNRLESVAPTEESRGGTYRTLEEGSAPFANLFVTMARQAGIDLPTFADSTGPLADLVAS